VLRPSLHPTGRTWKEFRSCLVKVPHQSHAAAHSAKLRLQFRTGAQGLMVYRCPFHPHWHVGHKPGFTQRLRKRAAQDFVTQ